MTDFTQDLAALDRLDRDLAAFRAHQKFVRDAIALHRAQPKQPPAPVGQSELPPVQQDGVGEGTNPSPSATKPLPAPGPMTEQVFDLPEGAATLLVPTNLSEDSCTDLKLQLERFLWDAKRRVGKLKNPIEK